MSRVPGAIPGIDLRSLPIGPEEAYVLSKVDGRTSESDIALMTGLGSARVVEAIDRLLQLGAIRVSAAQAAKPRPDRGPPATTDTGRFTRPGRPIIEARGAESAEAQHPAAALYDPAELDEEADLDLVRKRRVLDFYYRLDQEDHYALLGVPLGADKKEIKTAYYEIVRIYHPDRYFGKQLGNFKPKLERIFQRITEAHDTLTKKRAREEYDQYLTTLQRNQARDRALSDEGARSAELERVRRAIEDEARLAERATQLPGGTTATPMQSSVPPRGSAAPAPPVRSSVPPAQQRTSAPPRPIDPEERRRALARKLGLTGPPARSSAPPPAISNERVREYVAEDLRRRYEKHINSARDGQLRHYVDIAKQASASGDYVSAANALRIAHNLAPDDSHIALDLEHAQTRANADLADSYLQQAGYELRNARWAEAAKSFEKAALGKPTAHSYERAAHCLLEAEGDTRHATELARKAVGLAPEDAAARIALARSYLKAGLRQSAVGEFERAATLAPNDDSIKDWLKRIRRNEI